jgi:flagellar hook-length control protein FliK
MMTFPVNQLSSSETNDLPNTTIRTKNDAKKIESSSESSFSSLLAAVQANSNSNPSNSTKSSTSEVSSPSQPKEDTQPSETEIISSSSSPQSTQLNPANTDDHSDNPNRIPTTDVKIQSPENPTLTPAPVLSDPISPQAATKPKKDFLNSNEDSVITDQKLPTPSEVIPQSTESFISFTQTTETLPQPQNQLHPKNQLDPTQVRSESTLSFSKPSNNLELDNIPQRTGVREKIEVGNLSKVPVFGQNEGGTPNKVTDPIKPNTNIVPLVPSVGVKQNPLQVLPLNAPVISSGTVEDSSSLVNLSETVVTLSKIEIQVSSNVLPNEFQSQLGGITVARLGISIREDVLQVLHSNVGEQSSNSTFESNVSSFNINLQIIQKGFENQPVFQNGSQSNSVNHSPISPPSISDQVTEGMVIHSRVLTEHGKTEFHMRLDPPELGTILVRLQASDQGIQARLTVGDKSVQAMIESQLPELRQKLEASGISVSHFQVVQDGDSQGRSQGRAWQIFKEEEDPIRRIGKPPSQTESIPPSKNGQLDVLV